jgi:hypothetical protein
VKANGSRTGDVSVAVIEKAAAVCAFGIVTEAGPVIPSGYVIETAMPPRVF